MEEADRRPAAGRHRRTDAGARLALPEGGRGLRRRGRGHREQRRSCRPGQGVDRRNEASRMTDRYARQTVLGEVGAAGQQRLAASSVLVVGAGGLGCPVLQYLAGAGVGRLVIVDHDRVEETNLHRQPLYAMADIGRLKVDAAGAAVRRFNPGTVVEGVAERLTPQNATALVGGADLVVDAADS